MLYFSHRFLLLMLILIHFYRSTFGIPRSWSHHHYYSTLWMARSVVCGTWVSQIVLCNSTLGKPLITEQCVGRDSLVQGGNVSCAAVRPHLSVSEACHCVQPYYSCTVCHLVLGTRQRSLCARPERSGHHRSGDAKLSGTCLCITETQAFPGLLLWI